MGAWLNKLQYIHTIAIKIDELLLHVTTEMNLQRIMLSGKKKKSQSQNAIDCVISFI